MNSFTKYAGSACLVGLTVAAFASQVAQQLFIDGKLVSTNVTQANGHYEVPLEDVAKYFGYTMSINGSQASLTKIPPSNTTQSGAGDENVLATQTTNGISTDPTMINRAGTVYSGLTGQYTPSQPPPPTNISVALGSSASVNGFDYTVTSIQDAGANYKDVYDQRGSTLHPRWKTDSLVVINMDVTNRGAVAVQAMIPSSTDLTVFDAKEIGYQATGLDLRQASEVVATGTDDYLMGFSAGNSTLILGPGGTTHFAAIASLPKGDRVSSVVIKVAGGGFGSLSSTGAVVTINR